MYRVLKQMCEYMVTQYMTKILPFRKWDIKTSINDIGTIGFLIKKMKTETEIFA